VSPYHSGTVYGTTRADAVVTSLLAAPLADNYGRRMTLRSGAFVFTLGGAIQTFCNGFDDHREGDEWVRRRHAEHGGADLPGEWDATDRPTVRTR
jgi:MFS family permease